jgi:hypothetical protein
MDGRGRFLDNHFNLDRQLTPSETFKQNRSAALAE